MDNSNGGLKIPLNVPDLSKPQLRLGPIVNVLASPAMTQHEQLLRTQQIELAKEQIAKIMMSNKIFRVDAFLAYE